MVFAVWAWYNWHDTIDKDGTVHCSLRLSLSLLLSLTQRQKFPAAETETGKGLPFYLLPQSKSSICNAVRHSSLHVS